MWIEALAVTAGALVVVWLVLIAVLFITRPEQSTLADAARLIPDTLRLVRRLATDRRIPLATRIPVWLLLAYLVSPIDLVPDFIPVVGYADDAILTSLILRRLIRKVGTDKLTQHWPGTADGLERLKRLLRIGDAN
jgi:uncharacterized membrane protein YkvA (DUF1232 family)